MVRRAATLPRGEQPIPGPADPAAFDFTTLPAPQYARSAAYLAMLDAAAAANRNDPAAAIAGVRTGFGAVRACGEQPTTVGALVRIAVAAVTARSAERVLAWGEPADGLDVLQADFQREGSVPLAKAALRLERSAFDLTMTNMAAGQERPATIWVSGSRSAGGSWPGRGGPPTTPPAYGRSVTCWPSWTSRPTCGLARRNSTPTTRPGR